MKHALIKKDAVVIYPCTYQQLRANFPDVSFPAEVTPENEAMLAADYGFVPVVETDQPAGDPITQNVVEVTPVLAGSEWRRAWVAETASAEEIAVRQIKASDDQAKTAVKGDGFVPTFLAMTPSQVSEYINANGTTMAALRTIVVKLAIMVLILARRELR